MASTRLHAHHRSNRRSDGVRRRHRRLDTRAGQGAGVAFRAASGDLPGNYTPKVAVFAHPTDATGTKGDFEGETTSIEASFDFHPLKTRELNQIPARWPFWGAHHLQGDTSGAS